MFTRCLEEKRKQGKGADDSDIYNKVRHAILEQTTCVSYDLC